jgi:hypothetical protein
MASATREYRPAECFGPLTAAQAYAEAHKVVHVEDSAAALVFLMGDEEISSGRAHYWRMHFLLPQRRALAIVNVMSDPEVETGATLPVIVQMESEPLSVPHEDWRNGRVVIDEVHDPIERERLWRAVPHWYRPLPVPFIDSPHAVRAILSQCPTAFAHDEVLSGVTLENGQAVWRVVTEEMEYTTTFAAG